MKKRLFYLLIIVFLFYYINWNLFLWFLDINIRIPVVEIDNEE